MVSAYLYLAMSMTGFQGTNPAQKSYANALIGVVLFSVGGNIIFFLVSFTQQSRLHCARRRALKARKESYEQTQDLGKPPKIRIRLTDVMLEAVD